MFGIEEKHMNEYEEAYRVLHDGVTSAMEELHHKRWRKAEAILGDARKNAENCLCHDEQPIETEALSVPIDELGLPVHEYHILQRAGLCNLADVIALGPEGLRRQRNCGPKAYRIILEKLAEAGFEITDEWRDWQDKRPVRP